jgi:hypothetical protein
MSCKTIVSWESKTNADYHDSSIADECSHGMEKKKKGSTKEQQAMKTTSDMQQSFFLLLRWIKKIQDCHSIHTHTRMSTPNGLFMITCLFYTKCTWKRWGIKSSRKAQIMMVFIFILFARTCIANNRSLCIMNNNNNNRCY